MQAMDWILSSGWAREKALHWGSRTTSGTIRVLPVEATHTGDAFAHRDTKILEALGVFTGSDGVVQFLGRLVDHQHGPSFRPEELGHLVHDGQEDFFEFESLRQRARDLMEDAQMVHLPAFDHLELAFRCSQKAPQNPADHTKVTIRYTSNGAYAGGRFRSAG